MLGLDWQLEAIYIDRAQRSILISASLSIPTRQSFTNITETITDWPAETLSLPLALFRFWLHCRKVVREEQQKEGKFPLKTTNFTKGLLKIRD